MNEATRPLPEAIEDEYGMDPPVESRGRWTNRLQYVEPVMFLTMMSITISGTIQTNAVEIQYCKAVLGIYNSDVCLNTTASHFTTLQLYTSTFKIYQTINDSIFPIIFSVFLGPWSDTFGRRPVMLSSSVGYVMTSCLWVWGTATHFHPNLFLLFGLPSSLSGGSVIMISAMFCYVCDITSMDMRAQRLGILQGCIHLGSLVGTIAVNYLIKISYTFTFGICACANIIRLLYIVFFLKESVIISEAQRDSMSKNPFRWYHVRSLYETCYVKQSSHTFHMLVYVALLTLVSLMQVFGELAVFYLFLQKVLSWTLVEFTPLSCTSIIASAFAAFVGTWFLSKFLSLADMQVINIVNGLRLLGALVLSFGRRVWLIYIASVLHSAAGLYGGMIRVFLSRIVQSDDLGKVFALLGTLDLVTPLFSSLIYNTVYTMTINTYPSAIFLVSAFLCLLMTLLTAKIVSLYLRSSNGSSTTASINA